MKHFHRIFWKAEILTAVCICLIAGNSDNASGKEAICAVVKIEIRQELTLERQAFDAHMKINNGLAHLPLENVNVAVSFADEDGNPVLVTSDPDNTEASFFIRADSEGVLKNSDGSWDIDPVEPASSSDIAWLIIPAPGSADGQKEGKMYYAGATLTYSLGGETHTTTVTPDYIFVKPLPQIALDYFLPEEVFGNDAWTPEIEPPVPFTLGVRVQNTGESTAHNLRIDSAQPEIVENEQGLRIDFSIEGSQVNGEPARNSLLVDFGDIEPGGAKVGRWIMTCSLSGRFVDFDATVSHADELGGELTSLIRQEDVQTRFLVKDVRIDLPGKDDVHDFLARDGGALKVFASSGEDLPVADHSADTTVTLAGQTGTRFSYTAVTPDNPEFIYFKRPDPHGGDMALHGATRSDGKTIHAANAWLSRERKENPQDGWDYYVNLFDAGTTGTYTLVFGEPAEDDHSPELLFIPDKTLAEKQFLSFFVEAAGREKVDLELSATGLPATAVFDDLGGGFGVFEWTPAAGQAGEYHLVFGVSDGHLKDTQAMTITVYPYWDTDGDGMADAWEMAHFGHLGRDGTGDYDGDGISDLDEYLLGTDPTTPHHAPTIPIIAAPADKALVDDLFPAMVIENSQNSGRNITDQEINKDDIFYEFELYSDAAFRNPVEKALHFPAGETTTSWQPLDPLSDNSWYYWRVRASDGAAYSLWAYGSFFVGTEKIPPGDSSISGQKPRTVIKNPGKDAWVGIRSPELAVHPAQNPDGGPVAYTFDICADKGCKNRVLRHETIQPAFVPPLELDNNTRYYWRTMAADSHGTTAGWSETALFFVRQTRPVPEITGKAPATAVQGAAYSFTPSAKSADTEDSLIFAVTGRPDWAQFDKTTGRLYGMPSQEHVGTTFTGIEITLRDPLGAFASLPPFDIAVIRDTHNGPVAVDDGYATPENTSLEVAAPGVLENDIPGEGGGILVARLLSPPSHGHLTLNEDGSFVYLPFDGYTGGDSFTYAASDGTLESEPGVVSLLVTGEEEDGGKEGDADKEEEGDKDEDGEEEPGISPFPQVSPIDDAVTEENTAIEGIIFTLTDPEVPAGDLVLHAFSDNTGLIPDENIIFGGSGENRTLTVIPAQNRHGRATLTITATRPSGESAAVGFTVEVVQKQDPQPRVRYFIVNPELLDAAIHVASLSEDNHITAGGNVLRLERYEWQGINPESLGQGDPVSGTGEFAISGCAPGTNMPVPESFAGKHFVIPHVRGTHTYYIASPYGDASVTVQTGEEQLGNISIARGEVHTFAAGRQNSISSAITSDLPVLISHKSTSSMGCDDYSMDAYPVPPAALALWGARARDTYIGAMQDDTAVTVTHASGQQEIHILDAGPVVNVPWEEAPGNGDNAVYLAADKPIGAVQTDGVRGSASTALLGEKYHARRYVIPVGAQSVTAVCKHPGTAIALNNGSGETVEKLCPGAGEIPGSVRFDSSGLGEIPAGSCLEGNNPFYVIFEADCGFSEERNILGTD